MGLLAADERAAVEEREADKAAIDTAVQTFRYDHDLITAEETEHWLAERGLTLSDFSDYFTRHYWAEAMGADVKGGFVGYFSAQSELRDVFLAELIFSGELGRMATRLTWRLAAAAGGKTMPGAGAAQIEAQGREVSPGRDQEGHDRMSLLENNFRVVCEDVLSPQARQREVGTLRLQLTMFDLEVLEVDSRDAAREALFCVREDGMAMEEVATEGRYPFHREQLLLEDISPEMQQQFRSVTPGSVQEPMEIEGAHRLCRVVAKHEPDPADAGVQRRIEQRLLDRHFANAVLQHVRWDLSLS